MKTKSILLVLLAISLAPLAAKASADLSIQITVTPQSPQIGDTIQYHCVVTNNGPGTATSINGYFGPDNSDGGCNPQNPQASCDKYTNFVSSDPAPFFTDSTNFRYVRLKQNGQVVQQLASGESGTYDVNYQATANGTAHRLIGVNSPDDSTPANNSQNVSTTIGAQSDYDAVRDFNKTTNTPDQTWQYGFTETDGTGFTKYPQVATDGLPNQSQPGMTLWTGQSEMSVVRNYAGADVTYNQCTLQQPDVLGMFPSSDGRKSVVRWLAPASGSYSFQGRFQNIDHCSSDGTILLVRTGQAPKSLIDPIYVNSSVCHNTDTVIPFTFTTTVNVGDKIDFRLGRGTNDFSYDGTGLAVKITPTSTCPLGQSNCGGICVNLQTDPHNCGTCGNNCPSGYTCSNGGCVPVSPPHGGLSATSFTVNGSQSSTNNVADTVLRFSAQQTGTPADLLVRVQATTTPNSEGSWTDLDNGRKGRMTLDKASNHFVLNANSYPAQNGVYFRALSAASGYSDSISNAVGPFNLASNKSRLGSLRLFILANGPIADFYFQGIVETLTDGMGVRVQSSTNPNDELSWSDLANGGAMQHSTNPAYPRQYILLSNNVPASNAVYFRAIASLTGSLDSLSNVVGPFSVVSDSGPVVTMTPPTALPGSGNGHDASHPILVSQGTLHIGASAQTNRSIGRLELRLDNKKLFGVQNGSTSIDYSTSAVGLGDHLLEAVAVDDLGATARGGTGAIYLRVVSASGAQAGRANISAISVADATGKTFTAQSDGFWSSSNLWKDQNGNKGVPGPNDFAIIGSSTVSLSGEDLTVASLSLNGGKLLGNGTANTLTILGTMTIHAGSVEGPLDLIVATGATLDLLNPTDVRFNANANGTGAVYNHGRVDLHGAGGIKGLKVINNSSELHWQVPLTIAANAAVDPAAAIRRIDAQSIANSGLVSGSLTTLLHQDGSALLNSGGASLVGSTLIGHDGAGLLHQDGSGLLHQDGSGLIGSDASGLLHQDGSGRAEPRSEAAATTDATFTQTGGEIDLSSVIIAGSVAINGGTVSGSGIIAGNVINNGFIEPGHSAGGIAILGDYTQGANGTLVIENAGAAPGQYDQLLVSGNATLDGALHIRDINGYTPDPADTFSPLGFTSMNGAFASISSNAHVTAAATGLLTTIDANVAPPPTGQPTNISTRMKVKTDDNVLIGGFIVTGPSGSTKKVLIHGLGPSLSSAGLSGLLSDPLLEFHYPNGSIITNDNWGDAPNKDQIPDGFAPKDPKESIIIADLAPGVYTAIVKGAHGETGIGMTEVYDIDGNTTVALTNVSTRGFVETGDNVMIGGFIVGGGEPGTMLVRVAGPSLKNPPASLTGVLEDPTLELHDANGDVISNDNWRETQESEILAANLAPKDDKEPAIMATLVPGVYTAIVRGKDNTTGIAIVEAFKVK